MQETVEMGRTFCSLALGMSHLLASLHIVVQVSKLHEGKVQGA